MNCISANGSEHDHLQANPEREQGLDQGIQVEVEGPLRLRPLRGQVHPVQRSRTSFHQG